MQKKTVDEYLLTEEERSLLPFQGGEVINYSKPNGTLAKSYTANAPELTTIEGHSDHAQSDSWLVEQLVSEMETNVGYILLILKSNKPQYSTQFMYQWRNDTLNFPGMFGTCWLPIDTIFEGLAYPLNFYFSPTYGVVKMNFSDSTYWELESIEW